MKVDEKGFDENKVYWKESDIIRNKEQIDRITEGKLDLKHYEMMKEELKMKDIQIENLEKTISKLKKCESCTYGKRRNEICDDCDGSYSKWQIRR